jgi:hypothetical protein
MNLLVAYVITVLIGQSIAISIGLMVDRYYSTGVSLPISLALYFFMFWVAWRAAVYLTEPRAPADRQRP